MVVNETFESLRNEMEAANEYDQATAHIKADDILVKVALNIHLTSKERQTIVTLYNEIDKWFS